MHFRFASVLLLLALLFAPSVFATPTGNFTVGICSLPGAGVTIRGPAGTPANSIDWTPPIASGNGCLVTGTGTMVNYVGGGPLVNAMSGMLSDILLSGGSITDFMMFSGNPNLHFDLTSLGPGPANTVCASTLDPNAPACSIAAGFPFKLTATSTGTDFVLSAIGLARDLTGSASWIGNFNMTFPGVTPAQIQAALISGSAVPGFCVAGACTTTFSGAFTIVSTAVPEPVSLTLLGAALIGGAALSRRLKLR